MLGPDEGNPIQYTGRENDGTGLYYYRARYYDPVLKQFVSEDPVGTTAGLNFRQYVNGSPVSFNDPLGLMGGGGPGKSVPWSNVMNQTWSNIKETNEVVWGVSAPVGMTLATAGITAQAIGGLTALQLVQMIAAGTIGAELVPFAWAVVGATAAINIATVNVAFQGGVAVGSFLRALNQCYTTVPVPK